MGTQLYNSHYRYSCELFSVELLVASWLVGGGGGTVGLGLRVLGLTLVGNLGNVSLLEFEALVKTTKVINFIY